MYRRCKAEGIINITPVVVDMLNSSPSLVSGLLERSAIVKRASGDIFLSLPLFHHICINDNVPIPRFPEQLSDYCSQGKTVEWVENDDAIV